MSVEIENLRKDIRMRAESDPMMSNAWLLVYLIPVIGIIVGVLSVLSMIITSVRIGPPGPTIPPGPTTPPWSHYRCLCPSANGCDINAVANHNQFHSVANSKI